MAAWYFLRTVSHATIVVLIVEQPLHRRPEGLDTPRVGRSQGLVGQVAGIAAHPGEAVLPLLPRSKVEAERRPITTMHRSDDVGNAAKIFDHRVLIVERHVATIRDVEGCLTQLVPFSLTHWREDEEHTLQHAARSPTPAHTTVQTHQRLVTRTDNGHVPSFTPYRALHYAGSCAAITFLLPSDCCAKKLNRECSTKKPQ